MFKRILAILSNSFLFKIVSAVIVLYLTLILFKLIANPLLIDTGLASEETSRIIRFGLNIILSLAVYYFFFKILERRVISELAFDFKHAAIGFGSGFIFIYGLLAILYFTQNYGLHTQPVIITALFYPLIVLFFLALFEELIFRAVIYRILTGRFGLMKALVISAFVFALPHLLNIKGNWVGVLSAMLGGILLCLLYEYKNNIWLPVFFHYGWNLAQGLSGLTLSGSDEFKKFAFFKAGPIGITLLNGGSFGLENSIIILIVLTIAIIMLFFKIYFRERRLKT